MSRQLAVASSQQPISMRHVPLSQATARPRLWASRDPNKATSGFEPLYEALQASA